MSAFVALGRIFDQDHKSLHNIDKLIKAVSDDLPAFTRSVLAIRKQTAGISADDAAAYVYDAYELTPADVKAIRKQVAHWRRVYEATYRDIRHGVFAHKGFDQAGTDSLMAKTNIEEMKALLRLPARPLRDAVGGLLQRPETGSYDTGIHAVSGAAAPRRVNEAGRARLP
jgi:AbiU2